MSKSLCFTAGSERYPESGNSQPMSGLRKLSNNRNNKENEFTEAGSMAEGQAFPSKDPAARKVSDKLGARLRVGSVGEAGRSSAHASAEQGTRRTSQHCLLPTRAGALWAGVLCMYLISGLNNDEGYADGARKAQNRYLVQGKEALQATTWALPLTNSR